MDILPMDTPLLDIMARDLLMPSQKLRLMPDSIMEDMDMVLDMQVLDMLVSDVLVSDMLDMDMVLAMLVSAMLVLAMLVLAMLDMDMAILPMDTPPLDTMARGLLKLSHRPKPMLDSTMEDMDMVLDIPVLAMLDMAMVILPMA